MDSALAEKLVPKCYLENHLCGFFHNLLYNQEQDRDWGPNMMGSI